MKRILFLILFGMICINSKAQSWDDQVLKIDPKGVVIRQDNFSLNITGFKSNASTNTGNEKIEAKLKNQFEVITIAEFSGSVVDNKCSFTFDLKDYLNKLDNIKKFEINDICFEKTGEGKSLCIGKDNDKSILTQIRDSIIAFTYQKIAKEIFPNQIREDKEKYHKESAGSKKDSVKTEDRGGYENNCDPCDALSQILKHNKEKITHKIDFTFSDEDSTKSLNTTFSNPSLDTIHYTIKTLIDEEKLADNLAPKINYLNMDTYVGPGAYFWGIESKDTWFQPINIYFITRPENFKNSLWKSKPLGFDNAQPFLEGNLQTFSGRGAMFNLGYGIRLINSDWSRALSINGFLGGGYINTEIWNLNDTSKVKSFYEGDAGVKIGFHRYFTNPNIQFGFTFGISGSVDPLKRTYNLVSKTDNSKIIGVSTTNYSTLSLESYISWGLLRMTCGYKKYLLDENKIQFKNNGFENLWQVQLSLRLNKN